MVDLTASPTQRLVALAGDLDLDRIRASNEASNELEALLADEGPVDEDRVEALLRSAVLPDCAVGVFIEVPLVGP